MKKMIVCDLDGTLLNAFHTLDWFILNTIDKVLEKEVIFVVATGRSLQESGGGQDFGQRPIYLISSNGATIRDVNRNILFENGLDPQFVKETLKKFPDYSIDYIGRDKTWVKLSREQYLEDFNNKKHRGSLLMRLRGKKMFERFMQARLFNVSDEEILSHKILKINLRTKNEEQTQTFNAHLKLYPQVVNLPFANSIYELTDNHVNKGRAVKQLAQHLNIEDENIYVFGDGGNDVPMLSMFKNSFVSANGIKEAKEVATHQIGHYYTYAVARKIRQLLRTNFK